MNTLYSLALTSRAFLASYQHALYKAPLRALLARPTWPRAESLLRTLNARPGFALHIRELPTLGELATKLIALPRPHAPDDANKLAGPPVVAPFGEQSKEAAIDLALRLAQLATGTISISIPVGSEAHLQRSAKILTSLSRVTTLRLSTESTARLHYDAFNKWLTSWSGREMKKVTLSGLEWVDLPPKGTKFGLPISARDVSIEESRLTAFQLPFCLPRNFTSLKKLNIASYSVGRSDPKAPAYLEALFKLIGQRLRAFSFSALQHYEPQDEIDDYGDSHYGPTLPLGAYQAFPLVTSLTLRYLAGMTPSILAEIARSSPKIKTLDLQWTEWTELQLDGVEDALIAALDSFGRLKKLNLGYIRVDEEDPYELDCVVRWARDKGVELEWQGCLMAEIFDEDGYGCECDRDCYEGGYNSDDDLCYDSECDGDCDFSHGWDI